MELTKLKHPVFAVENTKQREIMRALGNVGVLRTEDARKHFGAKNLATLAEKRFLTVERKVVSGKVQSVVHLEKKGMAYTCCRLNGSAEK